LAHLVGAHRLPRHLRAALPVDVDRLDGLERDVHGAVNGGAGALEHARDPERLVTVLDERDGAETMRDNDTVADAVAKRGRHLGPDNAIEEVIERAARRELQRMRAPIAVALEILGRRAEHAEAAVAVTK